MSPKYIKRNKNKYIWMRVFLLISISLKDSFYQKICMYVCNVCKLKITKTLAYKNNHKIMKYLVSVLNNFVFFFLVFNFMNHLEKKNQIFIAYWFIIFVRVYKDLMTCTICITVESIHILQVIKSLYTCTKHAFFIINNLLFLHWELRLL